MTTTGAARRRQGSTTITLPGPKGPSSRIPRLRRARWDRAQWGEQRPAKAFHPQRMNAQARNHRDEFALDPEGCLPASSPIVFVLPAGTQGPREKGQPPKVTQLVCGRALVPSHPSPGPGCHLLPAPRQDRAPGGLVWLRQQQSSNRWAFLLSPHRVFQRIAPCRTAAFAPERRPPAALSRC